MDNHLTVIEIDAYKAKSACELVEIVDERNEVQEPRSRLEMRRDKLIHRATYAFIRNSSNYYYVQKRSMLKDYCPGYYDPTPGGVVAAGENYEVTNRREVEEEMGICCSSGGDNLNYNEHLFTFYYEDERIRCFGDAWDLVYDGPLRLQREEVEAVEMMSMREILDRYAAGERFTPDSIFACEEYVRVRGIREALGPKPSPDIIP